MKEKFETLDCDSICEQQRKKKGTAHGGRDSGEDGGRAQSMCCASACATERVGREMRRRAACGKGSGRDVGSLVMMDESSTQMHSSNDESVCCVCVCVRDRERSERYERKSDGAKAAN